MGKIKSAMSNIVKDKRKLAIVISAAAVAVIAITLAIVLPLTLIKKEEKSVSQTAQSFINLVMRIKTPITLDSEADVEAGYILYDFMTEEDKEISAVKENKELLDGYKSELNVLRAAKDEEEANAKQAVLRNRFENAVSNLPSVNKLTSENRKDLDAVLALYEQLNEQSRAEQSVQSAYSKFSEAERKVSEIEENERLAEIAEAAENFINGVDEIGKVSLDSINTIEDLLYSYENFSQEVKDFEGVAEAKQTLDEAYEIYQELKDEDDAESLKDFAKEFSPVETKVTLESERDIVKAESIYKNMSDRAKAVEGVTEAYEIIVAAREKYDALFAVAEAERIQIFIEAANAVGTDLENVDITWFDVLDAASDAYWNLDYASQQLPEVEEAFNRWDAAQAVFDKQGHKRIPMTNPVLLFSGHNTNAILVLQNENNMLNPLYDFYEVSSSSQLEDYVYIWLNVYVDGEYLGRGTIPASQLSHEIAAGYLQNVLRELAEENDLVVSGTAFSFTLSVEDKEGKYIPSAQSGMSPEKVYTW